jgi:hypothetical protein
VFGLRFIFRFKLRFISMFNFTQQKCTSIAKQMSRTNRTQVTQTAQTHKFDTRDTTTQLGHKQSDATTQLGHQQSDATP